MTGMAFLLYRNGLGAEQIYYLEDSASRKIVVGRDLSADMALVWDRTVSTVHAEFEHVADDWALIDDGLSRNGTFVNGTRLQGRCKLNDGDVIRFGETEAVFRKPSIGYLDGTLTIATDAHRRSAPPQ
jgi:pSer/pThr/pTyr-binding forkhead associated (FHA) protein